MSVPLCRCRVLYIGSAVPTVTKDGLQGIQQPLTERYPVSGELDTKGIDSWLSIYSNGLLLEYLEGDKKTQTNFFSITNLHYCAAVKYVNLEGFNVENGENNKFIPLDSPFASIPNSPHPPIFAAIFRRTTGIKVLECHAFICTNEKAANALVRCCFCSYSDTIYLKMDERIPGLKAIKDKSEHDSPDSAHLENGEFASKLITNDTEMWNEVEGEHRTLNKRQLSSEFGKSVEGTTPKLDKKALKKAKKNKKKNASESQSEHQMPVSPPLFPSSPPHHQQYFSGGPRMPFPPGPFFPPPPHMNGNRNVKFMPPPPPPGMFMPYGFHPHFMPPPPQMYHHNPYYMERPPSPPMVIQSNSGTGPLIESYYDTFPTFPRRHTAHEEPIYMSGQGIYGTMSGGHHPIYSDRNEVFYETYQRRKVPDQRYDESQANLPSSGSPDQSASKFWQKYEDGIYRQAQPKPNETAFMSTINGSSFKNEEGSSSVKATPSQIRKGIIKSETSESPLPTIETKLTKPPTPPIDYETTPIQKEAGMKRDYLEERNHHKENAIY
uniref:PID domain-containing protein n=1 Tax=Rhabditophanes sp. KR3021 TaxID=114890 RepID=A0AC35U393_9BILA